MNIEKMTRAQFDKLPMITEKIRDFDSIVLLPTARHFGNGWNYMTIALCDKREPIGILPYYDVVHLFGIRIMGIDCLHASALMRIHFAPNTYECDPAMHTISVKE